MLEKIWTALKHNHSVVVGAIVCIVLIVWVYGCEITVKNPFQPNEQVTRVELDNEVKAYADKITASYSDLQKKEEIRALIFNAALAYTRGEGVNTVGVITALGAILGLCATVDNRRKDAVIKSKTNALLAISNGKSEG